MLVPLTQTMPAGEFWRDVEREVDVLGPDGGGEAVAGVIGDFHGFRWCAEGGGDQHRVRRFRFASGAMRRAGL